MSSKKYNVGVIGYGMSAKLFQIPLIVVTPTFNLHSIVQRSVKIGDDNASEDHPSVKIYKSADLMFADPEIDIIVVTTPPDTHFTFTKAALQAGKHVIVEKPFVPTSAEASDLITISKDTGKLICIYQNRRWDSDFITVKKLITEGTLGRIVEFETHFDRYQENTPLGWKGTLTMNDAGGSLYDLGSHILDQAFHLFGMPKAVTAILANQRLDGQEPDSFTLLLHYGENGPLVTAKAAILSAEEEQLRYWVRGSKGSFKKFHLDVQEDQLRNGLKPGDNGFGIEPENRAGKLVVVTNGKPSARIYKNIAPETYSVLYQEFADAVARGDEDLVPVKASEARNVIKIIEAARESASTGKTVVL